MLPRFSQAIEFAGRYVVAHHIAAIFGKPQFTGDRMPVESDGIPDTRCKNFRAGAGFVHIQPGDGCKNRVFRFTIVAGSAYGNVQFPVGAECDVFPAVVRFGGVFVVNGDRLRTGRFAFCQRIDTFFDVIVSQNAIHLGHVQCAVVQCDPVWLVQFFGNRKDLVGLIITIGIAQGINTAFFPRANEKCTPFAQAQGAGIFNTFRIHADLETGWHFDTTDR